MLSPKIEEALNRQLNQELFNAILYLSLSAYYESISLKGMAHWMRVQFDEEQMHGFKIYDFINDRGGRVALSAQEAPPQEWGSPLEGFEFALAAEQKNSALINDLVSLVLGESDHATHTFMQWFVNEQVEEEANAGEIVDKLKLVGDDTSGLFMVDQELGQRPPATPPSATEA